MLALHIWTLSFRHCWPDVAGSEARPSPIWRLHSQCVLAQHFNPRTCMDPVSLVAIAVATGAAAALKDTAQQVVKDAYAGLRSLIVRRYSDVPVEPLEKRPDSAAKRASLEEDLRDAGAATDAELVSLAEALITAIERNDPESASSIGIDLRHVKAAGFTARRVTAEGTAVRAEHSEFSGDMVLEDIKSGGTHHPKG